MSQGETERRRNRRKGERLITRASSCFTSRLYLAGNGDEKRKINNLNSYLLMLLPSFSLSPAAPVLVALSLPAKSTRLSLPTFSPDVWGRKQEQPLLGHFTYILQQESNFISGANSCSKPFENGWIWAVSCAKSPPAASEAALKSWMMWSHSDIFKQLRDLQRRCTQGTLMKCWTMKNSELCQSRHEVHNPILKTIS